MRRYRHALITLAATAACTSATVALPAIAHASSHPKPTCHLIRDAAGDTQPESARLDILSGDVASFSSTVVGVLRMRSLTTPDPLSTTGSRWDLSFFVGTTKYTYVARVDAAGATTASFLRQPAGFPAAPVAAVTVSLTSTEVRWTVARSAIPELPATPAGTPLHSLNAQTYTSPAELLADAAVGGTYPDGNPSCVRG